MTAVQVEFGRYVLALGLMVHLMCFSGRQIFVSHKTPLHSLRRSFGPTMGFVLYGKEHILRLHELAEFWSRGKEKMVGGYKP